MSASASVENAPALSSAFLIRVLSSLVETQSVNPGVYEVAMAERVRGWVSEPNVEVDIVEFAPGRPSVVAVLRGASEGPRLVLNGHMDTVPVDDSDRWTNDPFEATVRDGFMYGRGACDMKAGLAVQIGVLRHFAASTVKLKGTLVAQFAAGEERGEPGTLSMLQAGFGGDFGIVTEPTELRVAVAERGLCHYRIRISGSSIHASRSHLGVNPIPVLREVLDAIERYDTDIRARPHPLLPGGSCTPTMVNGGVKENAVADSCELIVDRRLLPGESVDGELAALRARLQGINHEIEVDLYPGSLPFEAAEIPGDSLFANRLARHLATLTGRSGELCGTPFSSDVRNLVNDAGIEAVTFGPGNVAECHCADERVAVDQLADGARVIASVTADVLS